MIKRACIYDVGFLDAVVRIPDILEDTADDIQKEKISGYSHIGKLMDTNNYIFIFINENISIGFISFFPINSTTYDSHISIIAKYRGSAALNNTKEAIKWMFCNTKCMKILGAIPEFNKKAIVYAKKVGYSNEAIIKRSFVKGGKLISRIILSIEKEV